MFGYTSGPGGIRRGLIWQSGGVKASPAYLWDKGPFSYNGAGGAPECLSAPARLDGISPFKSGDNYNIFKIDMFMSGDVEYKNSSYSKMSPAGKSSTYGRALSPAFGAEYISLPYRLYGYIYMHYEPLDINDNTEDNQKAWYAAASSILNSYDLSSFNPGSNKITYNVDDGEFYTPQVLRFNPVEKYPGETIDNNCVMTIYNIIMRTSVSKAYYESNQVRITNNGDFSYLSGYSSKYTIDEGPDISTPLIHQIAFSLPRVNTSGKVQQIVPQIYKSYGLPEAGLVLYPSKASYEEVPAETVGYKKAASGVYHPDFIIDSTIDTVKMGYTVAGLYNYQGGYSGKWAYSFRGAVQPFVNIA